jgi:hypothetical protein
MKTKICIISCLAFVFIVTSSAVIRKDVLFEKYLEYAKRPEFASAGEVLDKDGNPGGSCVLISKKIVLTCAHLSVFQGHDQIKCLFGRDTFNVKKFFIYKTFIKGSYKYPDLCLILLEKDVPNIKPALLYEQRDELKKRGSIIGYGQILFSDMDHSPSITGQRIGGQNMVDSIGGPNTGEGNSPSLLFADFDSPHGKKGQNMMGGKKALPLEFGLSGGDSGGPLYIKEKGQYKVAGIAATVRHITSPLWYGSISGWTRVSVFSSWIEQTVRSMESSTNQ